MPEFKKSGRVLPRLAGYGVGFSEVEKGWDGVI
jgi:hypothetical protein